MEVEEGIPVRPLPPMTAPGLWAVEDASAALRAVAGPLRLLPAGWGDAGGGAGCLPPRPPSPIPSPPQMRGRGGLQELGRRHQAFVERGFRITMLSDIDDNIFTVLQRRVDGLGLDHRTAVLALQVPTLLLLLLLSAHPLQAWRKLATRIVLRMTEGFNS